VITLDRYTFKTIQQGIRKLTGQKIAAYDRINKLVTLKVVKLLYLIMRNRDRPSLFGLLAAPENGRPGLEYREAYPNAKNEESTWLVADIKEYLGTELELDRTKDIEIACSRLMSAFTSITSNVDWAIASVGYSTQRCASIYVALEEALHNFRWKAEQGMSRLDEALYIYLSTLEFRHFANSYPLLIEIAVASQKGLQVASIVGDLEQLAQHMISSELAWLEAAGMGSRVRTSKCRIPLALFPRAAADCAHEIRAMMSKALRMPIEEKAYQQCISAVQNLLKRVCKFEPEQRGPEDKVTASIAQVAAAFCAVYFEREILQERTNHRPYWHGQKAEGGSLLGSLEKPLTDADVLEEHSQIWRLRLEWFQAANGGYLNVFVEKMAFRTVLLRKMGDIARTNNTEVCTKTIADLIDHLKETCLAMVEAPD